LIWRWQNGHIRLGSVRPFRTSTQSSDRRPLRLRIDSYCFDPVSVRRIYLITRLSGAFRQWPMSLDMNSTVLRSPFCPRGAFDVIFKWRSLPGFKVDGPYTPTVAVSFFRSFSTVRLWRLSFAVHHHIEVGESFRFNLFNSRRNFVFRPIVVFTNSKFCR